MMIAEKLGYFWDSFGRQLGWNFHADLAILSYMSVGKTDWK